MTTSNAGTQLWPHYHSAPCGNLSCIRCGGFWYADYLDPRCLICGHRSPPLTEKELAMDAIPKKGPGRPKRAAYQDYVGISDGPKIKKPGELHIEIAPPLNPQSQETPAYPEPLEGVAVVDQPFYLFLADKWELLEQEIDKAMIAIARKKREQEYLAKLTHDYRNHCSKISHDASSETEFTL